ncbi:MAG TPA: metallophosphoesterase [Vicinamibacterales bacterium]|nr:metallophosphoesterase [Vicinamibacterales bacterium]
MRRYLVASLVITLSLACVSASGPNGPVALPVPQAPPAAAVPLPNRDGSLKFAVLGDFGTGSRQQYELAAQMAALRERFPFELVVTVGDNIYGSDTPDSYRRRFEEPYKALLDGGVKFYASLGNHDAREQRFYKPFNMEGREYYSFKAAQQDVRFFALESDYLDLEQITWLEKELQRAGEAWKIAYFHHPIYSSGRRHGSDSEVRRILEPLFVKYNVSVVLAGHDHFYERIKPQNGIVHFVVGSGGQLRRGNIDRSSTLTASGFDTDQVFLAAEIHGDEMFFNAISRSGQIVDSGIIVRRRQMTQQEDHDFAALFSRGQRAAVPARP